MWIHRSCDNCPCKECTERHLRCHSDCVRYKEWLDNFHKEYDQYKERKDIENYDAHEAITGKRRRRIYIYRK